MLKTIRSWFRQNPPATQPVDPFSVLDHDDQQLSVVPVKPGDVVVLEVKDYLTVTRSNEIKEKLELLFPDTKVAIIDGGAKLRVFAIDNVVPQS
jgi:hypothetical protein